MRAFGLLVMLIILIAAVFFSMANRDAVGLGFWPLDLRISMPLFLPILGALALGFVLGWAGAWSKAGQVRKQLRQSMRSQRDAAVEIDRLKGELKAAQSASVPQIGQDAA